MELFISLSFLIPLVSFIWIEVVVYRNYLKAVADIPHKQIRSTLIWVAKSLLGALPPYLLTILIKILADFTHPPNYWKAISNQEIVAAFIGLSLAIGIPLGLLWGISRAANKDRKNSIAENLPSTLASTVIMLIKIFLSLLFILLLIEAIFSQGVGFEIFAYLAFGWASVLGEQIAQLFTHWKAVSIIVALSVLILIVFHGFMNWSKGFWKVRWTAGLAGVVTLVFLSGYAFIGSTRHTVGITQEPIVHKTSGRYDLDTKSNLHNVYLACKAYWSDHGPDQSCNREIASGTTYGYVQSSAVRIQATGGEEEFRALATNINSEKWFWMDKLGTIQPLTPSKRKS